MCLFHVLDHLRPRDDDGLSQVLQHEAERRGGVGEGVGAVEDDEAVEVLVGVLDVLDGRGQQVQVRRLHEMGVAVAHLRDLNPVVHGHVAGVEEGVVLVDGVDDPLVVGDVREDQWEEDLAVRALLAAGASSLLIYRADVSVVLEPQG